MTICLQTGDLSISVVMPAYNAAPLLAQVLAPLLALRDSGEVCEVLVVDDQSSDDTADLARSLGANVLTNPSRGGPGAARNYAASHAIGDILWLVDSDVIAHMGGAAQIATAFRDATVDAVFGSYDDTPADRGWMSQYKNLMHRYYHQRARREASTFWAGCGAVRKTAFLAVGGFDTETYKRPSIEDIELGYRIKAAGGRILLLPDLLGKHLKRWTLRSAVYTDIFCRALPWSRLMVGGIGVPDDLNTGMAERLKAGLAGLMLAAIIVMPFAPRYWWVGMGLVVITTVANWPFLRYLGQAGGLRVAILGGAFHQIYYVYSACTFVWSLFEVKLGLTLIRLPRPTLAVPKQATQDQAQFKCPK